MTLDKLIDKRSDCESKIFSAFGFEGRWRYLAPEDLRDCFWFRVGTTVYYAYDETEAALAKAYEERNVGDMPDSYYSFDLLNGTSEYETSDHVLLLGDTHCDFNQFAFILLKKNEV